MHVCHTRYAAALLEFFCGTAFLHVTPDWDKGALGKIARSVGLRSGLRYVVCVMVLQVAMCILNEFLGYAVC
jgi:hypothetical protein